MKGCEKRNLVMVANFVLVGYKLYHFPVSHFERGEINSFVSSELSPLKCLHNTGVKTVLFYSRKTGLLVLTRFVRSKGFQARLLKIGIPNNKQKDQYASNFSIYCLASNFQVSMNGVSRLFHGLTYNFF